MNKKRCVITGMGVVSPLGNKHVQFYTGLRSGLCGIREMTEWDIAGAGTADATYFGSPVELDEKFIKSLPRSMRRSMSKISLYASCAALQAIEQAGLQIGELNNQRTGCIIGSTMGGTSAISEAYRIVTFGKGLEEMSSMQFFKSVSHTAVFNVSHFLNITGTVMAPCAACASALQSIGHAMELISFGKQDIVVCGGAEELAPEVSGSFEVIYAGVSSTRMKDPKQCSRPFDSRRSGLVCGEGAGIFVLEELEHAKARGAEILAEVVGYATCGCGTQISQSDAPAIRKCLEMVYADAEISPDQTDYINAHATSTLQGDFSEATAIREFFGEKTPPVSSLKGHIGHTLGASGALELAASLKMMQESEIIPTLNLESPGEGCEGIDHVMAEPRKKQLDLILKNSFAFGGINAALLCKKYQN